ncbi:MAG: methyltransferase domain-containing protein [Anaerobiospirillum succiniciproducens]|uniref:methyltransferase domain-containing protein n=1 Tax=Anaerobiospirillum succiniciproducens TaxID=13335 RepID=UPI002A75DB5F|nr:methyltransferase domain-containing protein [Anaerobiospirillum succiniciproducens]MDY2799429.1 methyltransferase domain-containing protein [Anaerobiospirillum succiniciproducens]
MSNIISYEQFDCCPVCGSKHYTIGSEHKEMLQMLPMKAQDIAQQDIVKFTPALCENCGLSFNLEGLSNHSRGIIYKNYQFLKPSTGVGAANYVTFINEVRKHLKSKDDAVIEIGGYDGYLLRELSKDGYHDLTLIDPSVQTDDDDTALQKIVSINGFFPSDDPVYKSRHANKEVQGSCIEHNALRRYKVVAAKDVLQMIDDPLGFIKGMNDIMELGGIAVLTSVPLHTMHSLQCVHLGINAYTYIAQQCGFTLIDTYKRPENGYVVYVLRKDVDLIEDADKAKEFAKIPQRSTDDFQKEQQLQRELIKTNGQFGQKAAAYLKSVVKPYVEQGQEIVIYGTGFYSFCILDTLNLDMSKTKLTLVNSSQEQDGFLFMLPSRETIAVHYAKRELSNRHIPLLILGIMSPLFKAEIESFLKEINCSCDQIVYLPDHDA